MTLDTKRDGRIFGKGPGSPYTLMRLASLVPDEIPVEIWDENLYDLPMDTIREGDLVGITAMTTWANLDGIATITDRVIDMVDENNRYWTPYLEITRGCPRNCSFCTAIRVSGQRMRLRPIDEVVDEIQRRGIRRFFLTDDNFGLNFITDPDYCSNLFDALSKLDLLGWTCQSEMSVADHPELLQHGKAAQLDKHFIGFESVNPDNRNQLGGKSKGQAMGAREAIQRVRDEGVGVVGLFVMGFDEDTPATFQSMWDFIRTSDLDSISITMLTPFPGTPFRDVVESEGRLLDMIGSVVKPTALHRSHDGGCVHCFVTLLPKQVRKHLVASAPTMAIDGRMPIGMLSLHNYQRPSFGEKARSLATLSFHCLYKNNKNIII